MFGAVWPLIWWIWWFQVARVGDDRYSTHINSTLIFLMVFSFDTISTLFDISSPNVRFLLFTRKYTIGPCASAERSVKLDLGGRGETSGFLHEDPQPQLRRARAAPR